MEKKLLNAKIARETLNQLMLENQKVTGYQATQFIEVKNSSKINWKLILNNNKQKKIISKANLG